MGKGTIVFTFDDVIALTTYNLYEYILANIKKYDHLLDVFTLRTKKDIYERENPNLIDTLLNKKVINKYLDKNKKDAIMFINMLYFSLFKDYYSKESCTGLEFTNISKKVLKNPLFTETGGIKRIVVIFKYRTPEEKKLKYDYLKSYYNNSKIEIIPINIKDSYYNIIKTKIADWNLLITDSIDTVEKLSKEDIDHKEFLLPEYGYNKSSPELIELIKQKSGTISYYKIEN